MDMNSGKAASGGNGISLASLSTRNTQSTTALCELFGVDRGQLDRLIDDAWAQGAEKDPQLLERALSVGVALEISSGGRSATLQVKRNRRQIVGRPLYVMWPQGQEARAVQAGPRPSGGVIITAVSFKLLSEFMPDMAEAEIRSAVEESIERAEREGKVDTRWRPRNFREDLGKCSSLWLPSNRDGDRDVRIAYSHGADGVRRVFYVERQRAMKMLESFAYISWPEALESLAAMAKSEPWDDGDGSRSILRSYLKATYARVERQGKVCFSEAEDRHAAFDTGLATPRGDRIVAIFGPNDRPGARQQYRFEGFITPQDRWMGRANLPIVSMTRRATYVERSSDLVMGWSEGTPTLSEEHILIDRVDRLPTEFLRSVDQMDDEWKGLVDVIAGCDADEQVRENAYDGLRGILKRNDALFESLRTLIRAEANKAFEDLKIYPYNALPIYNPERDDLAFVLPIHLMSKTGRPNAALLVEEVGEGVFRAHTILTMEMAYVDARVISPPKNSWLAEQYSEDAKAIRTLKETVAKLRAELDGKLARDGRGVDARLEETEWPVGESMRLKAAVEAMEVQVASLKAEVETWKDRAQRAEWEVRQVREDYVRRVDGTIREGLAEMPGSTSQDNLAEETIKEPDGSEPAISPSNVVAAEGTAGHGGDHETKGAEVNVSREGGEASAPVISEEEGSLEDFSLDDGEYREDLRATLYQDGFLVIAREGDDYWDHEYDRAHHNPQEEIDTWFFRSDNGFSKRTPAPWFKWRQLIASVEVIGIDGKRHEFFEGKQDPWSMARWFAELTNLKAARFENVDLESCSSLGQLFYKCKNLETVEFGNTPIGPSTSVADVFVGCPRHIQLIISGRASRSMEERLLAELALRNPHGTERSEQADLEGLTWEQIAKISSLISEKGSAARGFGLCDRSGNPYRLKKSLTTNDGSQFDVLLVDLPSRKSRRMVFSFCSPVASRRMAEGGLFAKASWGESEARAWLNGGEFLAALPKDLVDVMVVSNIESYAGGLAFTEDRVYLPSIEDFPEAEMIVDMPKKGKEAELVWLRDSMSAKCFLAVSPSGKTFVHEPAKKEHCMIPRFGV